MSETRTPDLETVRADFGVRWARLLKAISLSRSRRRKVEHPVGIANRRMDRIEASRHRRWIKKSQEQREFAD
ncbi:hypothetical protein K2X83_02485 [Patescibacteria group bacterium]|nr:hypothetical protein [Patescibacteria group bacterium]